jgi:hypothetical protein
MNITNLTDVVTPKLERHGMVKHSFVLGGVLLAPGQSADLSEEAAALSAADLDHLTDIGAVAPLDKMPESYLAAKRGPAPASVPRAAVVETPPELEAPAPSKRKGG